MKQHYMELAWYRALAELRAEAARAYLGFLWWVAEPMLYMAAFYIIFGVIFQRGGKDFVPFLLCGLVTWKWFGTTVISSAKSIPANAGLMQQVYLPKYLLPTIVVMINTIKFLCIFVLLIVFLLVYGYSPTLPWVSLPLLMGIQLLLITGISGVVSAIVPFIPDVKLLLDNLMTLLFFLSGIFFDLATVPEPIKPFILANPMAVLIDAYRDILLEGIWPDASALAIVLVVSLLTMMVAMYLLSRFDRVYPKVII